MRLFLATFGAFCALAAPALADDPLLSGYSGPGGGDQVVLGSQLVGTSKPGATLRAPTATPQSAAAATAPATPAAPSSSSAGKSKSTRPDTRKGSSGGASRRGARTSTTPAPPTTAARPVPSLSAPSLTARPVSADGDAGVLPLPGRDLLLVLLGVIALAAVAVGTARVGDTPPLSS